MYLTCFTPDVSDVFIISPSGESEVHLGLIGNTPDLLWVLLDVVGCMFGTSEAQLVCFRPVWLARGLPGPRQMLAWTVSIRPN